MKNTPFSCSSSITTEYPDMHCILPIAEILDSILIPLIFALAFAALSTGNFGFLGVLIVLGFFFLVAFFSFGSG